MGIVAAANQMRDSSLYARAYQTLPPWCLRQSSSSSLSYLVWEASAELEPSTLSVRQLSVVNNAGLCAHACMNGLVATTARFEVKRRQTRGPRVARVQRFLGWLRPLHEWVSVDLKRSIDILCYCPSLPIVSPRCESPVALFLQPYTNDFC